MNLVFKHIKQIYFIGIGGIGMSALAYHFLRQGFQVYGFDRVSSKICKNLENEGAKIEYDDNLKLASSIEKSNSLIIYTPAVKPSNAVYNYFYTNGFSLNKRAQILGEISKDKICIAIAGTHGKTTITSILAYLLKENKLPVTAFLGGISENYKSNYIYEGDEIYVIEADEFDRSLLQLQPDYAVISNIDADHLDIYDSVKELYSTFQSFADKLDDNKNLFFQEGLEFEGNSVGFGNTSDIYAENIKVKDDIFQFDWVYEGKKINAIKLNLPGKHNVFNALCALSLAAAYRPDLAENFAETLSSFKGINRRFNFLFKSDDKVIIDDYAHHPSEINAVYKAVEQLYPGQKIMAVFQPHLFSRTQDFAEDFGKSLSQFDEVRLLEIYPAREEPIEGIHSNFLLNKISGPSKKVIHKKEILDSITGSICKIIVMMGAGDIGLESQTIKKIYNHEK